MPEDQRDTTALAKDMLRRLDPSGKHEELIRAFSPFVGSPLGRGLLRLLKQDPTEWDRLLSARQDLAESMAEAVLIFAPAGWAPSSRVPVESYQRALHRYRETQSIEEAEAVIVEAWNEPNRLRWALKPLGNLGASHEPYRDLFWQRSLLVDRALRHHEAGAYEASVPIVLAQIEGIVWDVTEGKVGFFSGKGRVDYLVDDRTVAGLPEGLDPFRRLVGRDIKKSAATGQLARHAIMHGRELGYNTRTNSTKACVLLLAVIDWAQPRAQEVAERLHTEREAEYRGSDKTDERGRRLDRRGFDRAQTSLRKLSLRQMAEYRQNGKYGDDLDVMFPGPARSDDFLMNKTEVMLHLTEDRQEFWAWRSTPSGWCFGIAGTHGPPGEWLYAGPVPPEGGIHSPSHWRGIGDPTPPDWR